MFNVTDLLALIAIAIGNLALLGMAAAAAWLYVEGGER
jgi:hypothetical protein